MKNRRTLSDPVLDYLEKKYPGREITAEMYVGANGIGAEEYGGERLAMVPRRLRRAIERLAKEARQEIEDEASRRQSLRLKHIYKNDFVQ